MSVAWTWGTTADERARAFPCDGVLERHDVALFRGVTVDASPSLVFRWLCQLRAAPYSYDMLDNLGRRSPQSLTPGLDRLSAGLRVMTIFELVAFEQDSHLTLRLAHRLGNWIFGDVAVTYAAMPRGSGTRLIVKMCWRMPPPPLGWLARVIFPWGDLFMMRRQLLNLKQLSERDARASRASADAAATYTEESETELKERA
jgi:hypothetical protein